MTIEPMSAKNAVKKKATKNEATVRRRAAYHEAAHAVRLLQLGYKLIAVFLHTSTGSGEVGGWTGWNYPFAPARSSRLNLYSIRVHGEMSIWVLYAGRAAERHLKTLDPDVTVPSYDPAWQRDDKDANSIYRLAAQFGEVLPGKSAARAQVRRDLIWQWAALPSRRVTWRRSLRHQSCGMDTDKQAFRKLWTTWKAGKGNSTAEAEKQKLHATTYLLLTESWWRRILRVCGQALPICGPPRHCEGSLRYLRRVRRDVLQRLQDNAKRPDADPVVLYRGIRGDGRATTFRTDKTPEIGRLLSYSTRRSGGIKFAALGKADGLLYKCSVPLAEMAFFEDPEVCKEYLDEYEVLVLHEAVPDDVCVLDANVKPRPKTSVGKKP